MSTTQSSDLLGGQPNARSSNLTLNLSSNNPFRNRAASPSPNSFSPPPPHSPFDDPPARPTSRNPFLDPSNISSSQPMLLPDKMTDRRSPTAEELFDNLIIDDTGPKKVQARSGSSRPPMGSRPSGGPPRGENVPPRGRGPPPSSHRPTRSQEEALRARRAQAGSNGEAKDLLTGSPQKRPERRPRRNSESSVMEKPTTDEEKKMREMRRRDRERRNRDGKDKPKPKRMDLIDQLDATSIFGTGVFHHDGPFDACNPHRNRKGSRRAPMQAFAKDSANNSIGGSGPVNQRPDHKLFMGQEPHDAATMYGTAPEDREPKVKSDVAYFDPKQRGEYVKGEETPGLGASTFLEGAPAARTAIQRNQAEEQATMDSGLGRKKSVVQRFRSIKRAPREYGGSGRVTSPGDMPSPYGSRSANMASSSNAGERNPFFNEFDKAEESISVKRTDGNPMSPMSPPVPGGATLERRSTADATMDAPEEAPKPAGNGFLSRVKSLKGGRRQRPEAPIKDLPSTPGTAM